MEASRPPHTSMPRVEKSAAAHMKSPHSPIATLSRRRVRATMAADDNPCSEFIAPHYGTPPGNLPWVNFTLELRASELGCDSSIMLKSEKLVLWAVAVVALLFAAFWFFSWWVVQGATSPRPENPPADSPGAR